MIIKPPDDRSADIAELEQLLARPGLDRTVRSKIEVEIRNIRAGVKGEKDTAFEIERALPRYACINSLRLEHAGRTAQIDHLMVSRILDFWVCESKYIGQGIAINENGEFTRFWNGRPRGMPSPIEQNERHVEVVRALLDSGAIELPTRMGLTIKPRVLSVVLISANARISRPKVPVSGLDRLVKVDALGRFVDKEIENMSPWNMTKLVSAETMEGVARQVLALHKPIKIDWAARFGLAGPGPQSTSAPPAPVVTPAPPPAATPPAADATASKYSCYECSAPVPEKVARFCWFNKSRFGGRVYCMTHQANFPLRS